MIFTRFSPPIVFVAKTIIFFPLAVDLMGSLRTHHLPRYQYLLPSLSKVDSFIPFDIINTPNLYYEIEDTKKERKTTVAWETLRESMTPFIEIIMCLTIAQIRTNERS